MGERWQIRPIVTWTDPVTEGRRGSHLFRAGWDATLELLEREAGYLDCTGPIVVQVDVQQADIRADGMLKARARVGDFPGVVVSFGSRFGPLRYASDAYERQYSGTLAGWQANVRAVALALEALRAVDRYGVTRRGEQYQGWAQLEGGGPSPSRGEALVKRHGGIRKALFATHPDHGGNVQDFADVQAYRSAQ